MAKLYEEMTVDELRRELKERGMTQSSNGRKLKKAELIQKLIDDDEEWDSGEGKYTEEDQEETKPVDVTKESETKEHKITRNEEGYIVFAKSLEEIVTKYGSPKKQEIYNRDLHKGSFVVFVHNVRAKNGNTYKKLRTAKVVEVNSSHKIVTAETVLGTRVVLNFSELLYIKGIGRTCSYPKDITYVLEKQRTRRGEELIHERFTENAVTD